MNNAHDVDVEAMCDKLAEDLPKVGELEYQFVTLRTADARAAIAMLRSLVAERDDAIELLEAAVDDYNNALVALRDALAGSNP